MSNPTQPDPRQAVIDGLRDLADFLEANPDVPVNGRHGIAYSAVVGSDDADRAEVDRVAALLDVKATDDQGHYIASRYFGPIQYRAVAIPSEQMRRYRAEHSYAGVVQPADEEVPA